MMRRIYKQRLNVEGYITTFNARLESFLKVDSQDGIPTVWYVDNEELEETEVMIACFGTGWGLNDEFDKESYIGTAEDGLGYIWHYCRVPFNPAESMERKR